MSFKRLEALSLLYSGESKTFVRKKLNIKVKKLNKWIENDTNNKEEKALHMHYFKIPKSKICRSLIISRYELNELINEFYENIIKKIESTSKKKVQKTDKVKIIYNKPDGFTNWMDNILNESYKNIKKTSA